MKTRLLAGASFGFMAAMIGAMGFASSETALASQDAPPAITVLVANYSQASPAILAAAEREAGRILGQAGLQASWLECSVVPSTVSTQDPCQGAPEANGIRLRILAAPVQDKFQDSVFDFAVHPCSRQCVLRICVTARQEGRRGLRATHHFG